MTNRQKQLLLAYLDCYGGEPDGLWGPMSRQAALEFQRRYDIGEDESFGEESCKRILEIIGSGETGDVWQGIRYFTREEFRCRCGGKYCGGFPTEPDKELLVLADRVRAFFGKPAIVSSGLRCSRHNAASGGVTNSRHLLGKAVDFRIQGVSTEKVLRHVLSLPGVRYAYAIDDAFIHMDVE